MIVSKSAIHNNLKKYFRNIKSKWLNKIDFGDYILVQLENPKWFIGEGVNVVSQTMFDR